MMPVKANTLSYLVAGAFLFVAGAPTLHGQPTQGDDGKMPPEIIVPIEKTEADFTFTGDGRLLYKHKPFQPALKVRTDSIRSFRIALRRDGKFAGAIAEDSDGQNSAFVLDLAEFAAIPLQPAGKWSGAQRIFWSPSGRHMLALCSYEGQRFVGVDLEAREVSDGSSSVATAILEQSKTIRRGTEKKTYSCSSSPRPAILTINLSVTWVKYWRGIWS